MTYNIPPAKRGDTWRGINSLVIKISGYPINFADREIAMQFRDNVDSPAALTLSTANSGIITLQPAATAIRILPFKINIPPGKYYYDLQVTTSSGYVRTYMTGCWSILPDITL